VGEDADGHGPGVAVVNIKKGDQRWAPSVF
jgi:hypothetical protein